jgi:hypothetical protein
LPAAVKDARIDENPNQGDHMNPFSHTLPNAQLIAAARAALTTAIAVISDNAVLNVKSGTHLTLSQSDPISICATLSCFPADRPSAVHSRGSLLVVTPPMYCLDIVRVIVPPRSAHSFRTPMVGDHVVIVRELFMADRADAGLFSDLSVEQLSHLGRGPQFPISTGMVRIFDSLHTESNESGFGDPVSAAARNGSMNRAHFVGTESHDTSPGEFGWNC